MTTFPNLSKIVMELETDEVLPAIGECAGALAILQTRRGEPTTKDHGVPDDFMTAEDVAVDLKFLKADQTPKVKAVYRLAERPRDPLPFVKPSPRKFRVPRRAYVAWKHRQESFRG